MAVSSITVSPFSAQWEAWKPVSSHIYISTGHVQEMTKIHGKRNAVAHKRLKAGHPIDSPGKMKTVTHPKRSHPLHLKQIPASNIAYKLILDWKNSIKMRSDWEFINFLKLFPRLFKKSKANGCKYLESRNIHLLSVCSTVMQNHWRIPSHPMVKHHELFKPCLFLVIAVRALTCICRKDTLLQMPLRRWPV